MKSEDILKQALEELMEEDLSDLPTPNELEWKHTFSEQSDAHIEELQQTIQPRRKKQIFYYKQILSIAAAFLLVFACGVCFIQLLPHQVASLNSASNNNITQTTESLYYHQPYQPYQPLYQDSIASPDLELSILTPKIQSIKSTVEMTLSQVEEDSQMTGEPSLSGATQKIIIQGSFLSNLVYCYKNEQELAAMEQRKNQIPTYPLYQYVTPISEQEAIIELAPSKGERGYLYLAYVNAILIVPTDTLQPLTYKQAICELTGSNIPQEITIEFSEEMLPQWTKQSYCELSIASYLNSYESIPYHVYLTPKEEAQKDLSVTGSFYGKMQLPATDTNGNTTWYDFEAGEYYLFAEPTNYGSSNYVDGYLTIHEDGSTKFHKLSESKIVPAE